MTVQINNHQNPVSQFGFRRNLSQLQGKSRSSVQFASRAEESAANGSGVFLQRA
jgi:hypothetical protein